MNSSKHIRFIYEDFEASEFSDSIEDFEGDVGKVLKNRQRSRMKKKDSSFAKNQLVKAPDSLSKSPKSGNGMKHKYHVHLAHRRAASQPLEREVEEWSEEEGIESKEVVCRRQACSLEVGGSQVRLVADMQLRDQLWRKSSIKELAAKKELGIQNNVAVNLKVKREELRLHQ